MAGRLSWLAPLSLVLLLAACGGGGGESANKTRAVKKVQGDDFSKVIARVGDTELTEGYFGNRYKLLGPGGKAKYSGEDWRVRFLDELIEETLIYKKAVADEFDRLPEVEARMETARRGILINAYMEWIQANARPTAEEIQSHYDLNSESYRRLDRIYASHIQCGSRADIDAAYAQLKGGTGWAKVVSQFSIDDNTRKSEGQLGWVNKGGYILGLGFSEPFTDVLYSLERGEFSEPFPIGDNWHIVKAGNRNEGEMPTLEEVRERIVEELRPTAVERYYADQLKALKTAYPVERYGDYQDGDDRSAEILYRLAAEANNPHAKVYYYETLVDQYPEDERADDSLFMLGFLYSEEFVEPPFALLNLQRLLEEYPESEFAEDARWLLINVGRAEPGLRGEPAKQKPGDVRDRIGDLREG